MKKIFNVLLACLIIVTSLSITIIAEDDNTIHISTIEEWNTLVKDCQIDIYSKDKTVILDNDLVFENNFKSIPYFNGVFDGNGNKITNVNISSSLINDGIFRITGIKSIIKNLKIDLNANHDANRFGLVGYNQGIIENVEVNSIVDGNNEIGLIAGYNAVSGSIRKCISNGSINGKHQVGGIVGINYGLVSGCVNNAYINNDIEKDDLDISTLTVETLTSSNTVSKLNDIGGIVGINYGVIQNCNNSKTIGHEHVGYNVGGIAGSQSGYVFNCTNHGTVRGRKEVGGIVGQAEPSMSLIFEEDYIQSMKRQVNNISDESQSIVDNLKDNKDKNYSYFETIIDNLNEAYDALDLMLEHKPTDDEFDIGKIALSASLRKALDSSKSLVEYNGETNDVYIRMKDVVHEISNLGSTTINFADSISNEKDLYVDVSSKDKESDKEGKICLCNNYANVYGDINVGGIAGAMAIENSLNPEDDFEIVGTKSFDAKYEIRDVIKSCNNYGLINIKRNNAGGICGYEPIGLIGKSINYGLLKCDEGNYIGGVAGRSEAILDSNYSKCFIFGNDYVGGIAGIGEKGKNNGSLAQILKFNSNAGAIFGNYGNIENEIVEKATEISNNWYIYDDLAGIDGISYDKKAYQISEEEFINKSIDDNLKKIDVIFVDDEKIISKLTLNKGDSFSDNKYPSSNKDNEKRNWSPYKDCDLNNLTRDLLFVSRYDDILPSIMSEDETISKVVLNGKFNSDDCVKVKVITDNENEIEYEISTTLTDDSYIDSYCVFANNFAQYNVQEYRNNEWINKNYKQDGRYAAITSDELITRIRVVKLNDHSNQIIYGGIVILVFILIIIIIKKKKK